MEHSGQMEHSEQIPFLGIQTSENLSRSLDDRFRTGDEAAFEEIYGSNLRKQVFYYLFRKVRNFEDADDLTEEVFIVVWKKHKKFDPSKGSLKMWLYGIAGNTYRSFLRHNSARPEGSRIIPPRDTDIDDVLDQQACKGPSPEEHLVAEDLRERLFQRLSEPLRDVVQLTVFDDLSDKEAAALLDIPVSTVGTRRFNALKQMREPI
jgi:RNA polymerase sigma-70 factor (ECF subfamily)